MPLALTLIIGAAAVVTFMVATLNPETPNLRWWVAQWRGSDPDGRPFRVSVIAVLLIVGSAAALMATLSYYVGVDPNVEAKTPLFAMLATFTLQAFAGVGILNGNGWARLLYLLVTPVFIGVQIAFGADNTAALATAAGAASIYVAGLIVLINASASAYFRGARPSTTE